MIHEYAFDIKLVAVARVEAPNLATARKLLRLIESIDLGYQDGPIRITEGSLSVADEGPFAPFEIDGVEV